ncbi:MAG: thiamine phosphate synthase [Bilifractor sp.]|jgi:thiamine-phosphate pyrophosphorylase
MCEADLFQNVIAVTNRHLCTRPFPEQIRRVCSRSPRAVILREKDLPEEEYLRLTRQIVPICRRSGVRLILHSYPEAAVQAGIRRIHLPLAKLVEICGEPSGKREEFFRYFEETGCSVHSVKEAVLAEKLGASYLTAGHIYPTDCKKGVPPRGIEFLKEVCASVSVPVCAIGGIRPDPEQIREVLDAGASGACIMSAMMRI